MLATLPPPLGVTDDPFPPCHHKADPRVPLAASRLWWLCAANNSTWLKRIGSALAVADVPHVLPVHRERKRKTNGTRYVVDAPLLGPYLFLAGDSESDYLHALNVVRGKLRVVEAIVDVDGLCRDLGQLLTAIEAHAPIGHAQRPPTPGDRYRVIEGAWSGFEGTLERSERGGSFLLLHVHAINRVIPLSVDADQCERIEE